MLYEDADADRCAKRLSDKLLHKIGDSYQCVRNLWSFDALGITDVGDAVADVARTADLLVVSVSGEREFSPRVEKWIELWSWLGDDTAPAVVAFFQNVHGRYAETIHVALRTLADQRGLEYFPHATVQPRAALVQEERKHLTDPARWQYHDAEWNREGLVAEASTIRRMAV